ncbi:MAG: thioredoxin-like domain-containing protein [Rhodospirillales bacterium]
MTSPVHAPEIDFEGATWFNVPAPLSLAALRGRLVILDFWTLCCINCLHMVPTLRVVEETFPDAVAVIGVHTPKFAAERDPRNLEAALARYGIVHPVVHDPDMHLWQQYAVRAWPTLVFVSPDGRVLGGHSGEPDPVKLIDVVNELLAEAQGEGTLAPAPLDLAPVAVPGGRLRFPGKIKRVPGAAKRWAVADAGHNQVVILDDAGREQARYGSGEPGFDDGPAAEAAFNAPQGLVCTADAVYVADTGNHAVRRIVLADGAVETIAGYGRRGPVLRTVTTACETALASPWDLEIAGRRLYVANAGTHQVIALDLDDMTAAPFAGSGAEDLEDGHGRGAALAQPSGLAIAGQTLYVADAETSAIRAVGLDGEARVTTLAGTGLFDFGHRSGPLAEALLQHPLGIAVSPDGRLYVADSYNGAVRVIDLAAARIDDLDESGLTCTDPVCLPLAEPAGLACDGPDRLLVADTNNHRILEYLPREGRISTWA